ncbi:NTP pyrophosphohydrolase MazG, putative catalytic core [Sesbania bispinosa]|nr:NTP pyrophosphohydrolase MazG, putative catalytic core [Sesbania bispinosa]
MAEFFHSTIDEVAALPQVKKDFEAVTKKLKDDEAKMVEALGKVKGLSDDNLKLTENNGKLLEEIEKLKLDLAAKKSETIQVVLEKQKVVEDFEAAKEDWKLKEAGYEKEIRRVEDLWDESVECFFHNAID